MAGLRIFKDGEELFLTDSLRGVYLDQVAVPVLAYDRSYARVKDGGSEWSLMSPMFGDWGLYNIRERYKEEYLTVRYGLAPEDVMVVKAGDAVTAAIIKKRTYCCVISARRLSFPGSIVSPMTENCACDCFFDCIRPWL